jgi:hypothetical protein
MEHNKKKDSKGKGAKSSSIKRLKKTENININNSPIISSSHVAQTE